VLTARQGDLGRFLCSDDSDADHRDTANERASHLAGRHVIAHFESCRQQRYLSSPPTAARRRGS
jgi:hypothetical protein